MNQLKENMITAETIRERLHEQPFRPFAVHMSDGRSFTVNHPEVVALSKPVAMIATDFEAGLFARCSILHVTSLDHVISKS